MKAFIILPLAILALTGPLYAGDLQSLEQSIIERAEQDPETAPDYFMEQIESGATPEEQAAYMYGMGRAHEKQGKMDEAINDYLSAEILGNESAAAALERLGHSP